MLLNRRLREIKKKLRGLYLTLCFKSAIYRLAIYRLAQKVPLCLM